MLAPKRYQVYLETFPCADAPYKFLHLAALIEGVARHLLPVIEDALREGLTSSMRAQFSVETERFRDREIRLDGEHWRSGTLLFTEDLPTTFVQAAVDTTNGVLRALNLD
jgi:hypothetical protein